MHPASHPIHETIQRQNARCHFLELIHHLLLAGLEAMTIVLQHEVQGGYGGSLVSVLEDVARGNGKGQAACFVF